MPPTQNTAPVLEFRCLYTHDLRRKSKRWQDGYLRFHTFNKRIMVYDVPRNFIGDSHWREDIIIQDGDELQLEKGVLVQCGDAIGRLVQDLTPLFEKRRQVPERSPRYLTPPRASLVPTEGAIEVPTRHLRPKSLNALLGLPRGKYGRAILSSKSPYQECHFRSVQPECEIHPAKRQRMNKKDAQIKSVTAHAADHIKQPLSSNTEATTSVIRAEVPVVQTFGNVGATALMSDEKMPISLNTRVPQPSFVTTNSPSGSTRSVRRCTKEGLSSLATQSEGSREVSCESRAKNGVSESIPSTERYDHGKPVNPLQFSFTKPRKKLMYKDLLPQWSPSHPSSGIINAPRSPSCKDGVYLPESGLQAPPVDDLNRYHRVQQVRFKARLDTHRQYKNLRIPGRSRLAENLPQNPINQRNTNPPNKANIASFPGQKSDTAGAATRSDFVANRILKMTERQDSTELYELSSDNAHVVSRLEPDLDDLDVEDSKLSQFDRILMTNRTRKIASVSLFNTPHWDQTHAVSIQGNLANQQTPITTPSIKQPRSLSDIPPSVFRREFPGPTISKTPLQSTSLQQQQWSPLKKSISVPCNDSQPPTAPSRIASQRAKFNPTNLQRLSATRSIGTPPSNDQDLDLGPWSREAFDLFGWRPGDGKAK